MRRLLLLLLMLTACAKPEIPALFTPDGLVDADDPDSVYYFRIYRGSTAQCDDCLLAEFPDRLNDQGRVAYFVSPQPSCALRRGDAKIVRWGPFQEEFSVLLELRDSGKKALARCADEQPEEPFSNPSFLVVAGGRAITIEILDTDVVDLRLHTFFGGPDIRMIVDALSEPDDATISL